MKKFFYLFSFLLVATITTISITSCGGDDDDDVDALISTNEINLYVNQKTTIAGAKSIVPANKFVATVSSNLEVKGFHVGNTTLTVNGKKTIPVTVRGRYHFYDDPITTWGTSISSVKSLQKQGTLSTETDKTLIYKNVGSAEQMGYVFDNGKLAGIVARVSTSYTSSLINYLNERYLILPEEVATYTYIGADGLDENSWTTVVMIEVQSASYILVYYMPPSSKKKAPEATIKRLRSEVNF